MKYALLSIMIVLQSVIFFNTCLAKPVTMDFKQLSNKNYNFPKTKLSDKEKKALKNRTIIHSKKPYLKELSIWLAATSGENIPEYDQIDSLFKAEKEWPMEWRLYSAQEQNFPLFFKDASIIEFYKKTTPRSADALIHYGDALKRIKNKTKKKEVVRKFWTKYSLSPKDQKRLYRHFKNDLTESDHYKRIQMLLAPGAFNYTNARNLAFTLGKGGAEYVEARIALQNPGKFNSDYALKKLEKVQPSFLNDPYLIRDRFYWHKSQDKIKNTLRAYELLNNLKTDMEFVPNPRGWWRQQRIVINRLIAENLYKEAYNLAIKNPFNEGEPKADLHFIAGWLALKKLNAPSLAVVEFKKYYDAVSTANSSSRAAYWLALAYEAANDDIESSNWYKVAAKFPYNFYGQLAGEKQCVVHGIDKTDVNLKYKTYVENSIFTKMYSYLMNADMDVEAFQFLRALSKNAEYAYDYTVLSDLALSHESQFHALLISKEGYNKKHILVGRIAFPILKKDILKKLTLGPLVHSIIRQESGFDVRAKSRVGALGLTQLMPFTAKQEAKSIGVQYRKDWLTSKPEYNVMLGEQHLKTLLKKNKGHHIMRVLAGYNAGQGRVNEWIQIYGDPGASKIDPIDWMESLPFPETRDYVRKVLENFVIYSQILSDKKFSLNHSKNCKS